MTLLKIAADLSVSLATIVSKIFSFIKPALSEVEVVKIYYLYLINFQPLPLQIITCINYFSITSPVFFSSD